MGNIFKSFVINNEIHVKPNDWSLMCSKYSQEVIIQNISDAIIEFDIKLPYREIDIEEVNEEYHKLAKLSLEDVYRTGEWGSKFEYKYHFNDNYLDIVKAGNKASDYFQQEQRWTCDATGYPSPRKTWDNEKFRLTLFKALFSLKVKEINPTIFRNIISLRKYIAAQFRPSAAKAVYDLFKPEKVLDFSMGWGDRILGAHAAKSVKKYVGFDPNISLIEGYTNQIKFYQSIGTPMRLKLYPWCAENPMIQLDDEFDMIFTSPPYFDKEKYDQSDNQSYKKYKKFDSWLNDFLFETIRLRSKNLKSGGKLIINIADIYSRKKLFQICDAMNDYISGTGEFTYDGAIGLRMPKRPMSKSTQTAGIYGEPIWIWTKI